MIVDATSARSVADGHRRDPREAPTSRVYRPIASPTWSPNGSAIAFLMGARSDRDIPGGDVCVLDIASDRFTNLTLGLEVTATFIEWLHDDSLLVALFIRGDQAIARINPVNGKVRILWQAPASFDRFWPRFSVSASGTVAVTCEDKHTPREVWLGQLGEDVIGWRQLSTHNVQARGWRHPRFSEETWTSADGRPVSGILLRPAQASESLVVWVHGGPNFLHQHLFYAWAFPWIIAAIPELLAAGGMNVLLPNPRGSFGWGNGFAEAVVGDMGGADAADILAGTDAVIERNHINPARIGIGGWSYGGFMSAWLSVTSRRFAAAVVGAGPSHWRSQHGTSVLGRWDQEYLRDDPYRIGGEYDSRSPLAHSAKAQTPTLLLHGEGDQFVPPGQAIELYTALREAGCPVELKLFPGEGHDFSATAAQIELAQAITGWFARWLGTDQTA